MELKFYHCKKCGKIIAIVKDSFMPTICCGQEMEELKPNTSDGSFEKHVPVIKVIGNTVSVAVGSKKHPMDKEHYIEWILLQTDQGFQQKFLKPYEEPKFDFAVIQGEKIEAAYEFCNVHGLFLKNNS